METMIAVFDFWLKKRRMKVVIKLGSGLNMKID